jgi:hypothetical protein
LKSQKFATYLTYGDRESKAFDEIDLLVKKGVLPDNKNEILRRGLHCMTKLAAANESDAISHLQRALFEIEKVENVNYYVFLMELELQRILNLSLLAQCIIISKGGLGQGDTFELILTKIVTLAQSLRSVMAKSKKIEDGEEMFVVPAELARSAQEIHSTLATLFSAKTAQT